jgi:hypothetical protein
MTILEIENNLEISFAHTFFNKSTITSDAASAIFDAEPWKLYDSNKMPEGLQKANYSLDKAIEQCYRTKPFQSDEERLEYLFKMYEEMTTKKGVK